MLHQTYRVVRKSIGLVSACVVLGAFNQACAVGNGQRHADIAGASPADARVRVVVPATPRPATSSVTVEAAPRADAREPASPPAPLPARPADAVHQAPVTVANPLATGVRPSPEPVAAPAPNLTAGPDPLSAASTSAPQDPSAASFASPTGEPARQPEGRVGTANTAQAEAVPDSPLGKPPAEEPGSLWDRMRDGFGIPEVESPLVQRHVAWYLNRPDYLARMVERSRRYLHFVVEELQKRDMPLDIALLPMIESAYNPVAYSRAHASGMWQFIPATGRRYGLEQNWWYDGRRDVTAATSAALDYLQKLYGDFGDWHLALAAYNCGEGAVARAIERNRREGRPTDYLSLTLPKETRNYLPKLQAVKNILSDPERYGIDLEDIPDSPYFIQVNAPTHIDVQRAAQLAELPLDEFRQLNPAHNRPVITPDGGTTLLLPVDKAEVFQANLEANNAPLVTWQAYTLRKNERLAQVAARFGVSESTLRQANGIAPKRHPRPGQTLLVPMRGQAADGSLEEAYQDFQPPVVLEPETGSATHYRVRRGDTLYGVAARHGVTVAQVRTWNHLKSNAIKPGQLLRMAEPPRSSRSRSASQAHAPRPVKSTKQPAAHDKKVEQASAQAKPAGPKKPRQFVRN